MFILIVVPSGSPVNVTVRAVSSTSLLVSWQPPEQLEQNGIITGFKVQVQQSDKLMQLREYDVTGDVHSYTVIGKNKQGSCDQHTHNRINQTIFAS